MIICTCYIYIHLYPPNTITKSMEHIIVCSNHSNYKKENIRNYPIVIGYDFIVIAVLIQQTDWYEAIKVTARSTQKFLYKEKIIFFKSDCIIYNRLQNNKIGCQRFEIEVLLIFIQNILAARHYHSIYLSLSRAPMQPDHLSAIVKLISVARLLVSALKIKPPVYD